MGFHNHMSPINETAEHFTTVAADAGLGHAHIQIHLSNFEDEPECLLAKTCIVRFGVCWISEGTVSK
ncbi:hypothetical protein HOLleu_38511 [Holothuria leucospilota]|uniref:Uncharacterized protein n=1 Tax=Holothuria leucospilota TaxID=206669 RepID=A0A9Q0YEN5_HOLLE|nr:hypothetical protein HOLleu_38511 [Holothuria leucospilota]